MCTVSWQREEDSYQVWFNRDEQRSRQIATPPAIYSSSQGLRSIYPVDPQGGGTWFGINEAGLTIGLLNDYQNQPNPNIDDHSDIRSRGLLVKDALETLRVTNTEGQEKWLSAECQQRYYRPFYLFILSIESLAVWNWDGIELKQSPLEIDCLTSSSWNVEQVQEHRINLFNKAGGSLDEFHRLHDPQLPKHSVKMIREDAQTVSVSQLSYNRDGSIRFQYQGFDEGESTSHSEVTMGGEGIAKKSAIFGKPFEFWPNVSHVLPFHLILFVELVKRGLGLRAPIKANYGLEHGGMSFVSKYQIQENIGHQHFPATDYISPDQSIDQLHQQLTRFTDANAYPVIVKPDEGMTGRGIVSIRTADDIPRACRLVEGFPYMAQAYVPGDFEFGVFWYRLNGQCKISGINQKHFPTVTGDGQSAVGELARKHPRYTSFWESFLKERDDLETILPATQQKILSRIGSHTMGCRFTDETQLANDAILSRINSVFTDFPGYNYGRLDVKSLSLEAFISGEFDVIEVNGIESQATHMFDPKYGFSDALKILNEHARILAQVSADQRSQKTSLISYPKLITETIRNVQDVQNHQQRAEDL